MPDSTAVTRVSAAPERLTVEWPDGGVSEFASLWLRDNRPDDRDAHSGQRLIDVADLPERPRIRAAVSHDGTVRVTFALPADRPGGAVSVVGDFNNWDPFAHPLRKRTNGTRSAAVTVRTGSTLRFRYLAEGGLWFDDETVSVQHGRDAVITV